MTAGKTIAQRLLGADLVLEGARPFEIHPGRELDPIGHDPPRLLDKADLVALLADPELDIGPEHSVLALDHRRALDHANVGHRGQRHRSRGSSLARGGPDAHGAHPARRPGVGGHAAGRNEDVLQGFDVVSIIACIADADRVTLAPSTVCVTALPPIAVSTTSWTSPTLIP